MSDRVPVAADRAPRIVFVALANDIGMERVPAAMGALGAACAVLSPPDFHCGQTRFVTRHFPLPRHRGLWLGTPFVRRRLEVAIRAWRADLVVPLDDIAAMLLRMLATGGAVSDRLRTLLETSLGAPHGYPAACSRAGLMRVAATLDIRLPLSCVATDTATALAAAERWGYPVVLKAEHSCGGHGVRILTGPEPLRAAMAGMRGGATAWHRWRTAGRHWIWGLAGLRGTAGLPPLLQAMVPGAPAMRTVATWRGRVLDGVSFVAERVHPAPTGPSTVVRQIEHRDMDVAVRRLVAALGCSGFASFDFVLDGSDRAHLIEMNPRPIGTTHLGARFGHDPCAALLARLRGEAPRGAWEGPREAPAWARPGAADPVRGGVIALFPKEIERDPEDLGRLRAAGVLHDVPHDDPAVVATYLRRLSRIHPRFAAAIADALCPAGGRPAPGAPDPSGPAPFRPDDTRSEGGGPPDPPDVYAAHATALPFLMMDKPPAV